MKKSLLVLCIASLTLLSCQKDNPTINPEEEGVEQPKDSIPDPKPDPDPKLDPDPDSKPDPDPKPDPETFLFTDSFDGNGDLVDYVTNKASALPETARVDGRYRAELTDNQGNKTLHYNDSQGRLDSKLVSLSFRIYSQKHRDRYLERFPSCTRGEWQSLYLCRRSSACRRFQFH